MIKEETKKWQSNKTSSSKFLLSFKWKFIYFYCNSSVHCGCLGDLFLPGEKNTLREENSVETWLLEPCDCVSCVKSLMWMKPSLPDDKKKVINELFWVYLLLWVQTTLLFISLIFGTFRSLSEIFGLLVKLNESRKDSERLRGFFTWITCEIWSSAGLWWWLEGFLFFFLCKKFERVL